MKSFFLAALILLSATASAVEPYLWAPNTIVPAEVVQRAAKMASKATRYPIPRPLPVVFVISDADMDQIVPGVLGLVFYSDPGKVLLNADTPSNIRFAVLVHELVHVMQARAGHIPVDCQTNMANELEAYAASARYLGVSGNGHIPVRVYMACNAEE